MDLAIVQHQSADNYVRQECTDSQQDPQVESCASVDIAPYGISTCLLLDTTYSRSEVRKLFFPELKPGQGRPCRLQIGSNGGVVSSFHWIRRKSLRKCTQTGLKRRVCPFRLLNGLVDGGDHAFNFRPTQNRISATNR